MQYKSCHVWKSGLVCGEGLDHKLCCSSEVRRPLWNNIWKHGHSNSCLKIKWWLRAGANQSWKKDVFIASWVSSPWVCSLQAQPYSACSQTSSRRDWRSRLPFCCVQSAEPRGNIAFSGSLTLHSGGQRVLLIGTCISFFIDSLPFFVHSFNKYLLSSNKHYPDTKLETRERRWIKHYPVLQELLIQQKDTSISLLLLFSHAVMSYSWTVALQALLSQARILEWVSLSFSRGSSPPRDWTLSPLLAGGFFTTEALGKPPPIS